MAIINYIRKMVWQMASTVERQRTRGENGNCMCVVRSVCLSVCSCVLLVSFCCRNYVIYGVLTSVNVFTHTAIVSLRRVIFHV